MVKPLRENQISLEDIFAASPDAIAVSDLNGNIIECNQVTLDMHGYSSKEELIGKNALVLIAKKDHERAIKNLKKSIEQGTAKNLEYTFLTKDGHEFVAEFSVSVIKDSSGKPLGFVAITKDITARKKAEEALKKSENEIRTLFESLPQKIFFKDRNSVYISCNENYAQDLKIKPYSIRGKTDFDFYPKKLAEKYRADDARIMESGKTEDIEEEYIQNGQKVFVHTIKTPVKDENGNVVGIMGIFWDITEHKQAEEALKESEEKFRMIFQNVNDEIIYLDTRGRILDVNDRSMDIFGYKPDEVIGKNFLTSGFLRLKDIPKIAGLFKDVISRGKVVNTMSLEVKRKNGSIIPVEVSSRLVKKNGRLCGILAIVRDISERKQMEAKLSQYSEHLGELVQKRTGELMESEKRYSVLVEEAGDSVATLQDGKIVFVNKKSQELIGYSRDELIGLPFEKLVDEKYRQLVKERYERRLRGETVPATYEVELSAKTGERVSVELSAARVNYQGRPADIIIVRDIRARKRMEEERLKLEKLATLGKLATMVGHDLRNPLTGITGAAYYLKTKTSLTMDEKTKEMLELIDKDVEYAEKIVSDLLEYSRDEMDLELTEITPKSIMEGTLILVNAPKNIRVLNLTKKEPKIKVDVTKIERVFVNIIKNAFDAMPEGGKLTVTSRKLGNMVELAFADTGAGMTKEVVEKLWTPFFTTKAKGMGLGLAICKRIVEAHEGSISVESTVGKGTTFTVTLPTKPKIKEHEEIWVNLPESILPKSKFNKTRAKEI